MIPILYDAGETAFATNGLGGLSDAITCKVTEERNGAYELEMQYPVDGRHFSDITHSRIIWAVPADGKPGQPFRIYKITKPLNGKCTIYAEHISYQLNHIPVMPFTATSCADALNQMVQHAAQDCPFDVWTDKEVDGPFTLLHPEQFRAILNGQQNSITDVYGKGEYEFDRWTVKLHQNRGTNTGAPWYGVPWYSERARITEIRISKDITGISRYAFYEAMNVESVVFEEGSVLQTIGNQAFFKCTSLKEITLPDSVTSTGTYVFAECSALETVVLPAGMSRINTRLFNKSANLASVYVPDGVTYIVNTAFFGCDNVVLSVAANSYAQKWAVDNNVQYTVRDAKVLYSGSCGENIIWELYSDGKLVLSGSGNMYDIPATTGVVIRYGKNLTDLKQEENIEGTITGVCPFWASDETGEIVTLPENAIWSANADNYPYRRTRVVDFTSDFEETPTEDQLRTRAKKYIEDNNIGIPDVNITIKFVPLWQTENYRDLAVLERVNLCDTISVYYDKLGVTATAKVVKTVYNVLKERYDSIEVGNAKTTLASTISQMGETITNQTQNAVSSLRSWVSYQSQLITGGLGGYITFVYNQDGTPAELLVMDQPSIGSAVNLIRMNNGGIAFSNNGYNGPFVSAWTIDGSFSADFVRTGTMVANRIRGGTLTLGSQDNDSGVLEVYDAANNLVVRADNTGLKVYGSDGSYVVMNATDGFAGYDRNGTKIYWAASQEFHMRNAQVEYDFTLAQTMRYIPIQISTNRGVGLVPYVEGVS